MNSTMTHPSYYIRGSQISQVPLSSINSILISQSYLSAATSCISLGPLEVLNIPRSIMQPKKVLSAATAAALLPRRANGQSLFDDAGKPIGTNETIYGPLKVIEIPKFPSTYHQYPDDIPPETRKVLINGGLHPICGNCNSTGCMCPDRDSIAFNGLCEGCRVTGVGALRCYCSPALDATPCGDPNPATECKDQVQDCQDVLPLYFCEPQRWDQNPELQNLATPSVVYDFQSATIMPPGVNALPTDPSK